MGWTRHFILPPQWVSCTAHLFNSRLTQGSAPPHPPTHTPIHPPSFLALYAYCELFTCSLTTLYLLIPDLCHNCMPRKSLEGKSLFKLGKIFAFIYFYHQYVLNLDWKNPCLAPFVAPAFLASFFPSWLPPISPHLSLSPSMVPGGCQPTTGSHLSQAAALVTPYVVCRSALLVYAAVIIISLLSTPTMWTY